MLLALVISYLSVFVAANPFHKYPFVFLLDVGNEELEKTNSEQIRVSVPGGSIALRYPAVGDGNTIGHVRVSGIDFGTDLKANIVDGGPGYKYFILVFMGNPGVPYDAVVTVQTVIDNALNVQNIDDVVTNEVSAPISEEDANNSAEDLSDTEVSNSAQSGTYIQNSNAELMQSSSNVYSYANSESMDENDDHNVGEENDVPDDDDEVSDSEGYSDELPDVEAEETDENESVNIEKDSHGQYSDDIEQADPNIQVRGIENDDFDGNEEEYSSKEQQYSPSDYSAQSVIVDNNLYSKYVALKDHLNFGGEVYSQEEFQKSSKPVYQEDPLDYEDPDAAAPDYEDEGIENEVDKYHDSNNNNNIESDDSYAVAY